MKEESDEENNDIENNIKPISNIKSLDFPDLTKFIFFDFFNLYKNESKVNIEEIYEIIKDINLNDISSNLKKLSKEQIESIINNIILNTINIENKFLINGEISDNKKDIYIFLKIYSLIKIIIEECLIDASQTTFININNEISNKFFNYFFTELINISSIFIKNFESLINDNENLINNLINEIFDIFNLLLPYKEQYKLLSETQKAQLFENNLNLLINFEKYPSNLSLLIIEKIAKILFIFHTYYPLDSDELKEIHYNNYNDGCIKKLRHFIYDNIIQYKDINNIISIIDFVEAMILYENIYFIDNNTNDNENVDNNKLFNLSFITQINIQIKKNFNLEENISINQQISRIINFLNEPNKKENYDLLLKSKLINNKDINKLKEMVKNINEKSHSDNPKTQMQKRNEILMNNNELLKQCYIKVKDYFFRLYNGIINFYNYSNQNILYIEEKSLYLTEIMKLFKYLLIIPEEENLKIFIQDKIFNSIVSIIDPNNNLFNDLCKEQALIIFNIITQNENIIHDELVSKDILFLSYILKEFINFINIFKNYLNIKQQNINNLENNIYSFIDKNKFKRISKIICELSKEKDFLKLNIQIINFNTIYIIFLIDDIESSVISLYINMLKNYLSFIQEDKTYISSNEDKNILATLIINLFNKYIKESSIVTELFSLIEDKIDDEQFIQLLINNKLSSTISSIFSPFSEGNSDSKNQNYYLCILPTLNTINNLLKYKFFINELLNIGINNIINCLNQYIFNSKICETFLDIIIKIIKNKENMEIIINKISLTDVKNLVVNILEKYLDTCNKNLIDFSLEIIEFFIESPNNLINFSKSNDKANTLLMSCLFKCININFENKEIVSLSLKILFRYISYVKINKEKSRANSLGNNFEGEDDDDLPDDLFSEEYPQVLKIFRCKYFIEFIDIYLVKILDYYLIKQRDIEIIKKIIEILRVLIGIIDTAENLNKLIRGIIQGLQKFINIFSENNEINKNDSYTESSLEAIKHFTFLSYKIISMKNEVIADNVIIMILLISSIINNFKINVELIERFLQVIKDITLYGNKTQLIKSITDILNILQTLRELYNTIEIKEDKKELIVILITKIIYELSFYRLDVFNDNLIFILRNIPVLNLKEDEMDEENEKKKIYHEFKNNLLKLCRKYYIESNEEAVIFLNIIKNLYNQYTSLSSDISKTNYEIRFILSIIFYISNKTPYLKEEIIKENQSILSQIKIYKSHLTKNNDKLDEIYEKCLNEIKSEREYPSKMKDIQATKDLVRNTLLFDMVQEEKFKQIKLFLIKDSFVYFYRIKDTIKCKIIMDENLRKINISGNENEIIDSIETNSISKVINDNSNKAFIPKGFFSRKPKSLNCFSIYINNIDGTQEEKSFNFECQNEEIASKYVDYLRILIELDNTIRKIK